MEYGPQPLSLADVLVSASISLPLFPYSAVLRTFSVSLLITAITLILLLDRWTASQSSVTDNYSSRLPIEIHSWCSFTCDPLIITWFSVVVQCTLCTGQDCNVHGLRAPHSSLFHFFRKIFRTQQGQRPEYIIHSHVLPIVV